MLAGEMSRHTTLRFCLDPTVGQRDVLAHVCRWNQRGWRGNRRSQPHQRPEPTTPEKGGANTQQSCSTRF